MPAEEIDIETNYDSFAYQNMTLEEKEAYNEEVFTKRWLYISLLCVLTFGFI